MHDSTSTDKRHPTVNAYGPIFGDPEDSSDKLSVLDPVKNRAYEVTVPVARRRCAFFRAPESESLRLISATR